MDFITQGVVGAAAAQAFLHKQDKHNAWLVGALAGMAADLDVFIQSASNPMLFFLYHRQFTHSFLFIPVGALLVTLILLMFKRFRKNWRLTLLAAVIGYATHGLLDACTAYGTVLFWPFSDERVSWDIISIIDPFVTIPLFIGLVWTYTFDQKQGVILALIFTSSVMTFHVFQHHRALAAIRSEVKKQQLVATKIRALPKIASSTSWKGIAINNRLLVFEVITPLFKTTEIKFIKNYPLFLPDALPEYVKKSPTLLSDFKIFIWFSEGYLILVKTFPLLIADGRFLYDENFSISLWGIQFLPNRAHVKAIHDIEVDKPTQ